MNTDDAATSPGVSERAGELYADHRQRIFAQVDRVFAGLMLVQWVLGIAMALVLSPLTWSGAGGSVHPHLLAAVLLGGALTAMPVALAVLRPGWGPNRYVVACSQMLWSALLIHLSGGRIETHFHVFGSLAFLAFYRDWRVLVPATLVVAADHLARQIYWPESVFGISNPEWWRFLEHAGWVAFEDVILVLACVRGQEEMRDISRRQALVEALSLEAQRKTQELADSQDALLRVEKLAAVGQLAASVGHELRNPLTAVKNANAVLVKRLGANQGTPDPIKIAPFLEIIEREVSSCNRIVGDLLDFARERPLELEPVSLRPLVEEAIGLLPEHRIVIHNGVAGDLPSPQLDRHQFRQILINLLQNAVEAIPAESPEARVSVTASGGGEHPWRLVVQDNGAGMSKEHVARMFEPLFTTKAKGTGLGMAIVAGVVQRHKGTISASSEPGRGTSMVLEIPPVVSAPPEA